MVKNSQYKSIGSNSFFGGKDTPKVRVRPNVSNTTSVCNNFWAFP